MYSSIYYCINTQHIHTKKQTSKSPKKKHKASQEDWSYPHKNTHHPAVVQAPSIRRKNRHPAPEKVQTPTEKPLHHYANSPIYVPSLYIPARKS